MYLPGSACLMMRKSFKTISPTGGEQNEIYCGVASVKKVVTPEKTSPSLVFLDHHPCNRHHHYFNVFL